jgi:cyclophilin family peptidyl-prolyl cis-trans isomerase
MKRYFSLFWAAACLFAQAPPPPKVAPPAATAAPRPDGLYAIVKTSMGTITIQLFEKETPLTVRNFVGLAKGTKPWKDPKTGAMVRKPLYNGINIHRIMMDGMIQAGDPTGKGDHDCGITIKDEIRPDLKFDKPGRLAMANIGTPNSGGCQWFITQASPIAAYDGSYTIFGQVVDGQDVVKAISRVPGAPLPNGGMRPNEPVKIISVTIERQGPAPAPATPAKKAAPAPKKSATSAKQ